MPAERRTISQPKRLSIRESPQNLGKLYHWARRIRQKHRSPGDAFGAISRVQTQLSLLQPQSRHARAGAVNQKYPGDSHHHMKKQSKQTLSNAHSTLSELVHLAPNLRDAAHSFSMRVAQHLTLGAVPKISASLANARSTICPGFGYMRGLGPQNSELHARFGDTLRLIGGLLVSGIFLRRSTNVRPMSTHLGLLLHERRGPDGMRRRTHGDPARDEVVAVDAHSVQNRCPHGRTVYACRRNKKQGVEK